MDTNLEAALENYAIMKAERDELKAINAELLKALKALVAADNCNYSRTSMRSEGYFENARAAIAKATGD